MSRINHDNIDKWLFDYVEGNLNASQKRELNNFLQAHPEYQLDLDSWQQAKTGDKDEAVIPYALEAELMSIAQPVAWKRYAAVGVLLLGTGIGTALYFGSNNETVTVKENPSSLAGPALVSASYEKQNLNSSQEHNSSNGFSSEANVATSSQGENNSERNASEVHLNSSNRVFTHSNNNAFPQHRVNATLNLNQTENNTNSSIGEPTTNTVGNETTLLANHSQFPSENTQQGERNNHVLPALRHSFDQYRPEIRTEESGAFIGHTAFDVIRAEEELARLEAMKSIESENVVHKEHHTATNPKRKKFRDSRIGLYNTRDHQLLQPNSNNTAEFASFAGSSVSPAFSINYRNQWTAADHQVQSGTMVYSQYSKKLNGAWGIGFHMDNIAHGVYQNTEASLYYSPKFKISKTFSIEPGIAFTYYQNGAGSSALSHFGRIEPFQGVSGFPTTGSGITSNRGLDAAFSTLVNTKYFYAAVGVDHILHPTYNLYNISESTLPLLSTIEPTKVKVVLGTDYKHFHESKFSVSPQLRYTKQGNISSVWGGALCRYDWFTFGAAGSQNGQFTSTIGIMAGRFRLNYNYDVTKSYMNDIYYGSHEVAMRINLNGISHKQKAILNQEK